MTAHAAPIHDAIDTLEQTIYRHNVAFPGVNPHSIPEQHRIYVKNKAIRDLLEQWLDHGRPVALEEAVHNLANAINGDTK